MGVVGQIVHKLPVRLCLGPNQKDGVLGAMSEVLTISDFFLRVQPLHLDDLPDLSMVHHLF